MQVKKVKFSNSEEVHIYLQTPFFQFLLDVSCMGGRSSTSALVLCETRGCHAEFLLFCHAFPPSAGPAWLPPSSPPEPLRRQRCARPWSSPCLSPLRSLQAPSVTSGTYSCLVLLLSCRISTTPITLSLGTTSVSLKAAEGSACAEAWPCSHAEKHGGETAAVNPFVQNGRRQPC